ncbi:MAG: S-methyl-5'-thioadenosine phosphorylase [Phycisphaeraceae bacterium]|nr:S-methyl-5'-thioadenosine phosphorylase [Phycisphaeraceae bacterium]
MKIAIIGGSGLGDKLGLEAGETRDLDTPFGKPSAPITLTRWHNLDIALLQRHGIGHTFNPSAVPYRANIFALKMLGVTHILASGAVGSLREDIHPGELVIADQVIDKTYRRANTFYEKAAVHVEFAQPFCPVMRKWLLSAAAGLRAKVHKTGTYVCMEGPAFSTRAESELHRNWGGHLIGMTVMPEAKLAREAEIAYALIAMPTDYDCWTPGSAPGSSSPQALLAEIIGNLNKAADANLRLMKQALADVSILENQASPAHSALALGIWSDKSKIDPQEIERLRPLWGRYF